MNRSTLAIMVGLPQSGKSTGALRLRKAHGHTVLCPDEVRLALHGHEFYRPAELIVWGMVETMARALLATDHDVIIDACNTSRKRRQQWIDLAISTNRNLLAYVVSTPKEVCIERAMDSGQVQLVPAIERMADNWQDIDEPEIVVKAAW